MGAKNCPETPRQRMIGMMYLVLTALLALNVSSDVLNAFTKVQAGLSNTLVNFTRKNTELYRDFDAAYINNPKKVESLRSSAYEVKKESEELFVYINELKQELVYRADGEDADINNIESKDNLDIAGELMLTGGKGKILKERIDNFRENLLKIVCDDNPVLCKSIKANLNTSNPPVKDGEFKSWEEDNFENIPLIAVVTLLTKMQTDVRNAESDIISYLYSNIDAESFKFNKLNGHVIPESRYILKGEEYKAKIILAATDTTQHPEVIINGRKCNYNGDAALYSRVENNVGPQNWKGIIKFKTPSGQINEYHVEDNYIVAEPNVVVSPLKMNVFYIGVDNPVSISVPGIASDNIVPSISNGTIIKSGKDYIVRPKKAGACSIVVSANRDNGCKVKLQTLEFRVKTVPDPIPGVMGKTGGKINKNVLLAASGVVASMDNFDFDMQFKVTGFSIFAVINGYVSECATKGHKFSNEQKSLIKSLRRGQRLVIEDITAVGPDGIIRKLPSLTFKID